MAAYLNRRSTALRSAARRPLWQRCAERLNTTLNRAPACSPHRHAQRLTTQTRIARHHPPPLWLLL
ncbi:Chromodomain-helicase-DNA-binding protein 1, partial [Frankliniella fusca]